VPDLEVVGVADDDGFVLEMGVVAEVRRERDPSLRVRVTLVGSGEQEVAEARRGGIRARALRDVGVEGRPLRGRPDGETLPGPTCHDRAFLEAAEELGRARKSLLIVVR